MRHFLGQSSHWTNPLPKDLQYIAGWGVIPFALGVAPVLGISLREFLIPKLKVNPKRPIIRSKIKNLFIPHLLPCSPRSFDKNMEKEKYKKVRDSLKNS